MSGHVIVYPTYRDCLRILDDFTQWLAQQNRAALEMCHCEPNSGPRHRPECKVEEVERVHEAWMEILARNAPTEISDD